MNIAEALKEKNKRIAVIGKLQERVSVYNSIEEGIVREYDPAEALTVLDSELEGLIQLKHRIHEASAPVRAKIFKQSELKSHVKFLRGVSTKTGTVRQRYSQEEGFKVTAQIGKVEMDKKIESFEKEIESIQNELDTFNHSTTV